MSVLKLKEYVAEVTARMLKCRQLKTNSQSTVSSSKGHGSSSKKGNSNTTNSTVNNSKNNSKTIKFSFKFIKRNKTEVTETVNSENVATDNSAAETASNDNANISLETGLWLKLGFEQRFQRIAVGESFNAATVFEAVFQMLKL